MQEHHFNIAYREYAPNELPDEVVTLFQHAKAALKDAYSPYSKFRVACAIRLVNDEIVTGTNQENAAYPAGICAEGIALGACASLHPNVGAKELFITIASDEFQVEQIAAPCGICRQQLLEFETRFNTPISVWLGIEGKPVIRLASVKDLLPLAFTKSDLL